MSAAIVTVIYGVPKTEAVARKIEEWEATPNDDRWFENNDGICGFIDLYSASGYGTGYCGVELDELDSYVPQLTSDIRTSPTPAEKKKAEAMVAALQDELKVLAGPIGVYYIWSDS